ncbi:FAD-dependent thymidylate synthase [Neisseria leonii]|uniref:FAD-dependent thymidylate synthase n=1 Tax=Neisseria leonii TaxID=2995413 RepID=A0A9X4IDZ9_9NEIS|nr:FAD-dependent thymidylate synthase [Neisseria sp. 51.81]MDD9328226.1 FAD-dependent thymidylate synthase [Neisseria sp. 51.81]
MNIEAKVIADSVRNGARITSLQLQYPRFIHGEFLTHRAFSRNSSSSRAIPVAKLIEQVRTAPAEPLHWGRNRPGMQADGELDAETAAHAREVWYTAAAAAADSAEKLAALGVHKQVANRILEPFQLMHTIVTATEWDNFFALRIHSDAQPEMQELASKMKAALDESLPVQTGYHLPYIETEAWEKALQTFDGSRESAYHFLAPVSAARCARVSYLNHDQSRPDFVKDRQLADKLREARHLSPFEHQAVAQASPCSVSANLKGWCAYRTGLETAC